LSYVIRVFKGKKIGAAEFWITILGKADLPAHGISNRWFIAFYLMPARLKIQ
jgi:hypothetical protein